MVFLCELSYLHTHKNARESKMTNITFDNGFDGVSAVIEKETEKAYFIRCTENNKSSWFPKSSLENLKGYETIYKIKPWFKKVMKTDQKRVVEGWR
jgi:hypothetical protein